MLSIVVWKWNRPDGTGPFSAAHVNTMRSMLNRHLHLDHRLHCFTNEPEGLDGDIVVHPIVEFLDTPRCRRRMYQYGAHMRNLVGPTMLALDLDIVITDDVTPLLRDAVDRLDLARQLKLWKVGYANVYSGSIQLISTGFLNRLYEEYKAEPEIIPKLAWPRGIGSDQAMLNSFLRSCDWEPPHWTEADGIYAFFGDGYERFAHTGVSPTSERLPENCRMVVLGSDDLGYLSLPIFQEHYR